MNIIAPITLSGAGGFSRASIGTYFDANGNLQTVGNDVKRISYDPANLANAPVLLVEVAATNITFPSEQYQSVAGQSVPTPPPTNNAGTFIDGTNRAWTMAVGTTGYCQKNYAIPADNNRYTFSIYAQALAAGARVYFSPAMGTYPPHEGQGMFYYDFDTDSFSLQGSLICGAIAGPNGYRRLYVSSLNNGSCTLFIPIIQSDATYTNGKVLLGGTQLEKTASPSIYLPTSYIPTTTAAITRAADVMADAIISSIAEPAAGEIEWVSAGTYAVGDLRIRKTTHRVYYCVQASTNRTELPENDPAYWLEKSPTNFAAPFDIYTNTAASAVGSISYAIKPGFANAVALYGVYGTKFTLQVVDGDSGLIIYKNSQSLTVPSGGWYEYFFVAPMFLDRLVFSGLPVRPNAILLITVAAASGIPVGIGMIIAGDFRQLIGDVGARGGTEYGISVEPITSSYINTAADGTVTIVRRTKATDMHANVTLDVANANRALQIVQQVLDVPVAWIAANDLADYRGLNVFGIGSAKMYHNNPATADLEINVKGII